MATHPSCTLFKVQTQYFILKALSKTMTWKPKEKCWSKKVATWRKFLETPLKEEIRRQGKRKWDGKGNEGKKNWIRVWVFGQKENDKGIKPKHWGQRPISPSLNQRNDNLVYPLFLPPSPITFSPLFTLPKKAINEFTNLLFKLNFQKYNLKQEFSSFQETRYKIQIKKSGDYKNK